MSRSISIFYRMPDGEPDVGIELQSPYHLFGTQNVSLEFWSLPRLQEIGMAELTVLGDTDPVYFEGWDRLATLAREIALLQENLESVDFDIELKTRWLSHLIYAYFTLRQTAPPESIPALMIG